MCFIWSLLASINGIAQSDQLNWELDYDQALTKASDNKTVLLSFAGSDWCKPCIMLTREVFETEEFKSYAQSNLILLQADFPRLKKNRLPEDQTRENESLAKRFNKEGSFPLVVLVDDEENIIGKLGYTPGGPRKFIEKIETLVNK